MKSKPYLNDKYLLSYVVGLALGDGNLSSPNGRVIRLRISCDTRHASLIEEIQWALSRLMPNNKVSIVVRPGNCVDISCYSNYWPNLLGWNVGDKFSQRATVPLWVLSDRTYTINCLRGLIETDGSIYRDRGYLMMIFVTIIPELAESFQYMVESLGFQPKTYKIEFKNNKWNYKKTWKQHIVFDVDFRKLDKKQTKDYDTINTLMTWAWNHTSALSGIYFEIYNDGQDFKWLNSSD
jgi:hypothetical protein